MWHTYLKAILQNHPKWWCFWEWYGIPVPNAHGKCLAAAGPAQWQSKAGGCDNCRASIAKRRRSKSSGPSRERANQWLWPATALAARAGGNHVHYIYVYIYIRKYIYIYVCISVFWLHININKYKLYIYILKQHEMVCIFFGKYISFGNKYWRLHSILKRFVHMSLVEIRQGSEVGGP
jgi:hypothetical protein